MLGAICSLSPVPLQPLLLGLYGAHSTLLMFPLICSIISAVAGVVVATVGASAVKWCWNNDTGLGAIFASLGITPAIAAGFAATIFMFIRLVMHIRKNPVPSAVYSSPFSFLIAGTEGARYQMVDVYSRANTLESSKPCYCGHGQCSQLPVIQVDPETLSFLPPCLLECDPYTTDGTTAPIEDKALASSESAQLRYKELIADGEDKLRAKALN
ncbi:hypothetical protein RJ035_007430 [Blastomyces gilchristii]